MTKEEFVDMAADAVLAERKMTINGFVAEVERRVELNKVSAYVPGPYYVKMKELQKELNESFRNEI